MICVRLPCLMRFSKSSSRNGERERERRKSCFHSPCHDDTAQKPLSGKMYCVLLPSPDYIVWNFVHHNNNAVYKKAGERAISFVIRSPNFFRTRPSFSPSPPYLYESKFILSWRHSPERVFHFSWFVATTMMILLSFSDGGRNKQQKRCRRGDLWGSWINGDCTYFNGFLCLVLALVVKERGWRAMRCS